MLDKKNYLFYLNMIEFLNDEFFIQIQKLYNLLLRKINQNLFMITFLIIFHLK